MKNLTPRKEFRTLLSNGYTPKLFCDICGDSHNLVIDHIVPLSKGGSNETSNLRTLCQSCNTKQGWNNRVRMSLIKYTTHISPQTIKKIKLQAVLSDKKDYQIVQEALDNYLK